jgi:hypothetical protein
MSISHLWSMHQAGPPSAGSGAQGRSLNPAVYEFTGHARTLGAAGRRSRVRRRSRVKSEQDCQKRVFHKLSSPSSSSSTSCIMRLEPASRGRPLCALCFPSCLVQSQLPPRRNPYTTSRCSCPPPRIPCTAPDASRLARAKPVHLDGLRATKIFTLDAFAAFARLPPKLAPPESEPRNLF